MKAISYIDGASSQNPGPAGWGAVLITDKNEVFEFGGAVNEATNNAMELQAAIEVLQDAVTRGVAELVIYSDSQYLIQGITTWVAGWKKNGWMTKVGKPVENQDRWKRLDQILGASTIRCRWLQVPAHVGVPGNEKADSIAAGFSQGRTPTLYRGRLQGYSIQEDVLRHPEKFFTKSKKDFHSYLSFVNGVWERHLSWQDCERHVKGAPGAKFKKAMTEAHALEILKSWGFTGVTVEDLNRKKT